MEPKNSIIIFPDFQRLKAEIARMRAELSMLLLERDELQFVVSKNISTHYMLELGSLEYKAYKAQCTALRLKRKIDLIQSLKNREEPIILEKIEEALDSEFAEYKKKLNEQIEKMNEAIERSRYKELTAEENNEIKKLYREIVKVLHPDLNPNTTDAQIRLFDNAVQAYKNGNLYTMRIIHEMVATQHPSDDINSNAMSILREKHEELKRLIFAIQDSIENIKKAYPFTVLDILNDPKKLSEKRKELEDIILQYNNMIEFYTTKLREMMR